mmetsp:Transcript_65681/g.143380  ORF Transcript_65681/g.143380 Transcript_65681/m.143380 type:complete len:133 (+) Transcript_65681:80-478(+)
MGISLGGAALWFLEVCMLWRASAGSPSSVILLLFLAMVLICATFVMLIVNARTTTQNNVDVPAPYLLIGGGACSALAVLATIWRTRLRLTYLIRFTGDILLCGCGYVWMTYCKNTVYAPPIVQTGAPSREYV